MNQLSKSAKIEPRRGAGVADQARLESVCSRKATVGSNPTLSAKFSSSRYFLEMMNKPSIQTMMKIAEELGVSIEKLLN